MGGEFIKKGANVYIKSETQQLFFFLPGMAWIVPKIKRKRHSLFILTLKFGSQVFSFEKIYHLYRVTKLIFNSYFLYQKNLCQPNIFYIFFFFLISF